MELGAERFRRNFAKSNPTHGRKFIQTRLHFPPHRPKLPKSDRVAWNNSPIVSFGSMGQAPAPDSEFACGTSLSAHGLFILLYARRSNELNAPKGKPRMRTLFRNPALFLSLSVPVCRVGHLHGTILRSFHSIPRDRRPHRAASSHGGLPFRRTASLSCCTQGVRTSLTRRKGSPPCELFSVIRSCSFRSASRCAGLDTPGGQAGSPPVRPGLFLRYRPPALRRTPPPWH